MDQALEVSHMLAIGVADELLVTLTGLFGGALITVATLAGAFLWRRIQEVRDRIRDLETCMETLQPVEDLLADATRKAMRAFLNAKHRRQRNAR